MKKSGLLLIQFLIALTFTVSLSAQDAFITTWDTTNYNGGTESPTGTIRIPMTGGPYIVDWGDGTTSTHTVALGGYAEHIYTTNGIYTVTITGSYDRIYFNNSRDRRKILEINQWGTNQWTSMEKAFAGCTNLVLNQYNTSEAPDLSIPNLYFYEDYDFILKGMSLKSMFASATSFDSDIGHWDITNITTAENMFGPVDGSSPAVTISTENYEGILIGWASQMDSFSPIRYDDFYVNLNFHGGNSYYCSTAAINARASLDNNGTNGTGWDTITDGGLEPPYAICPDDIEFVLDSSVGTTTLTIADLGGIENLFEINCGTATVAITNGTTSFDCTNVSNEYPIEITATSSNGTTANCTVNVKILAPAPTFTPAELAAFGTVERQCNYTFDYRDAPEGIDGCTGDPIYGVPSQSSPILTTTTLTWTYTSADGASTTLTQDVIITDGAFANYTDVGSGSCDETTIQLDANDDLDGSWTATSTTGGAFSFSDSSAFNSTFTGESGESYNITWTLDDETSCPEAQWSSTITVDFPDCGNNIDFNGLDNSINFGDNYDLTTGTTGSFSIEVWVKSEAENTNIQTILSKRDADNLSTGYDLRILDGEISFNANNETNVVSSTITTGRWYHIAITYNSGTYTLYKDGKSKTSNSSVAIPTPNSANMRLGAMARSNNLPTHYFNGWLDELRIWNVALSTDQIQEMMNQEIEANGTSVSGSVLGLDITGLHWTDLDGYYQMNQTTTDINEGYLNPNKGTTKGRLVSMMTTQPETAPLPYMTSTNGTWDTASTWLNNSDQMLPNTDSVNWNIVKLSHNITSGNRATTLLGLVVDNNTYTITNDQELNVTKYLKINGTLDLEGESQLIQPEGSIVDYTGIGKLERDQQGTTNLYNYNYWGSPVSNLGTSDNRTYALGSVLYDGTNLVNWNTDHDPLVATSPITISSRWLYTYANFDGTYEEWNSINESYNIPVGLGFTMKGSGAATSEQNYTFIGQPNNGIITRDISANNETLVGNPYPSAIDAQQFISDNEDALLDGKVIFWEQAPSNNSHNLSAYQGRYSYYNYIGGTAATGNEVTPSQIDGSGDASKIPERYIPVAQGFFVNADSVDGTITFKNSQRKFKTEDSESIFFRSGDINENQESNSDENSDAISRIRLNFNTPEGATRHLLLGFTSDNAATDGVDYGYDALNADYFPSDLSFRIEDNNYIIQGVGEFDITKTYPLDMVLGEQGNIEIGLTALENFDTTIDVFIYDALEGTYTQFNDVNFQMNLEAGNYSERFYIAFQDDETLSTIADEFKLVRVRFLSQSSEIYVQTPATVQVKQLHLVNLLGQTVATWNATNLPMSNTIVIPVKDISEGAYILKAETDTSVFNKKIIIKYN
ncbi:LamG-like jellyroll fold domain-containing protein [Winogradskyella vidalii]|uniref:LamG-like jellyroll fold domain-containing protein n=1 Tax=Winogradskyella vidalii TaxID=2615024 RepID=UPI0015C896BC|nr:LamG-like jellyroll fold domain-containing protein [Winogradskyella vidalii]